jgi:hypothetical protein
MKGRKEGKIYEGRESRTKDYMKEGRTIRRIV